ncbi:hypothetical protein J437_LFUL000312, partial [Ladona fulva]
MDKLHSYGIIGHFMNCFKRYSNNRKQVVRSKLFASYKYVVTKFSHKIVSALLQNTVDNLHKWFFDNAVELHL